MGIVARAMGEQAEEQQEPVDNQAEEAAERGGKPQAGNATAGQWGGDKVLGTARMLAFEIMYSDGGGKALEDRLSGSQDVPGDVADIVGNVLFATQQKAQANGRMIPPEVMQKLAMVLVFEVLNVASIMGLMGQNDAKQLAKQVLPQAMQTYAAAGQQGGQQRQPTPQPQGQQPQGGLAAQSIQGGV